MHDSKWIKMSDREKPHSASLPVLKHPNEIWFMSSVHDTKTHRLLWPAVCITTESHPSKLNVSNNSTSTQRFKTNPIRHILWQLLSLGSAVILSTAQLSIYCRKCIFLKAISHSIICCELFISRWETSICTEKNQ